MKAIQDRAIPALTRLSNGDWDNFSEDQQHAVANWGALFSMSFEFADKATVKVPASERLRFSQCQTLGDRWLVAIGTSNVVSLDGVSHRAMTYYRSDGSEEPVQYTVFDFGQVIFAIAYAPVDILEHLTSRIFAADLRTIHPFVSEKLAKPPPCFAERPIDLVERLTFREIGETG